MRGYGFCLLPCCVFFVFLYCKNALCSSEEGQYRNSNNNSTGFSPWRVALRMQHFILATYKPCRTCPDPWKWLAIKMLEELHMHRCHSAILMTNSARQGQRYHPYIAAGGDAQQIWALLRPPGKFATKASFEPRAAPFVARSHNYQATPTWPA